MLSGTTDASNTRQGPAISHGINYNLLRVGRMEVDRGVGDRKGRLELIPILALVVCDPMRGIISKRNSYIIVEGVLDNANAEQMFLLFPFFSAILGAPHVSGISLGEDDDFGIVKVEEVVDVTVEDLLGDAGLVLLGGGERSCCQQKGGQQYAPKDSHDA